MPTKSFIVALLAAFAFSNPTPAQQREPRDPVPAPGAPAFLTDFELPDPATKPDPQPATCGQPRSAELKPYPARRADEMRAAGKLVAIDPVTGEAIFQHLTDYLPADWGRVTGSSKRVDSYGDPIVNEVPGLPGWSERNVRALRSAIEESLVAVRAAPGDREAEHALGNYLGQAVVRGLDVDDLLRLDADEISPGVASALLGELHFYENLKRMRADGWGYDYRPSVYGERVLALIEAQHASLAAVLATEEPTADLADAVPSGCYTRNEFTRGMTDLSGETVIWRNTGSDDASADVPIGFGFNFFGCETGARNYNVRVSTNGYLTFFEQGGGAVDGTDLTNDAITSTNDPDGFVAPNWDDLVVATSQGTADQVAYLTAGAVGARVFTVEWSSVSHYGGDTTEFHYFQVKLFEADGNVELHFDTLWINDSVDSATVGIENFAGTDGDCGPNCNTTNTGDTITHNYRFAPIRPDNDACSIYTASCLESGGVLAGTTLGASGVDVSSCGYNDIHDVWAWYHAPVGGNVTFSTCGSGFDTTLSVLSSCGGGELSCSDDYCGLQSQATVSLTGGADYLVRVGGYNGVQGTYSLTATATNFASGDSCSDAWSLISGFDGYTTNNSGCQDETSCGVEDVVDEWFSFVAPASGKVTATTCNTGTDFDTTLAVFSSCGGAELACNDDYIGLCSRIQWDATQGVAYKLRLAGWGRAYGNYLLTLEVPIFEDGFESGNMSAWSGHVP